MPSYFLAKNIIDDGKIFIPKNSTKFNDNYYCKLINQFMFLTKEKEKKIDDFSFDNFFAQLRNNRWINFNLKSIRDTDTREAR